jgi:hypothetical protein
MTAERGFPPSRPPAGPPPAHGGPRRVDAPAPPPPAHPGAPPRTPNTPALGGPTPTSRGPRRLAPPRPIRVRATSTGRPEAIDANAVEAVRESWLIEDRWWTDAPLRRRYWEIVTADGRDLVVFRDLEEGRWYGQR